MQVFLSSCWCQNTTRSPETYPEIDGQLLCRKDIQAVELERVFVQQVESHTDVAMNSTSIMMVNSKLQEYGQL
jgi:hypothetical protein